MAERLGDVELQVYALATLSRFTAMYGREEARALAARAVELAEAHGLLLAGQSAHMWLAHRLPSPGSREPLRRGAELAGQAGLTASQIHMIALLARWTLEVGEFREAEQALAQARLLLGDLDEPTWVAARVQLLEIFYLGYQGQWAASAQQARALRASRRERGAERDQASASRSLGFAILESRRLGTAPYAGQWQEAEEALAEATGIYDRSLSPQHGIQTRALWGSLCLRQGRLADARRLLAEARQKAKAETPIGWDMGHVEWLAAQAAAVGGDWDEALNWFEAACKVYGDVGRRWWWARVRLDWAEAHATRGEPGHRQRAAELLREAEAAFLDMGVPRYAAIARQRLQPLEGPPPRTPKFRKTSEF